MKAIARSSSVWREARKLNKVCGKRGRSRVGQVDGHVEMEAELTCRKHVDVVSHMWFFPFYFVYISEKY